MVSRAPEKLEVIVDMPETLPLTSDLLALIETYMGDIVAEMMKLEAANDNFDASWLSRTA
jgi:hypothetical protein